MAGVRGGRQNRADTGPQQGRPTGLGVPAEWTDLGLGKPAIGFRGAIERFVLVWNIQNLKGVRHVGGTHLQPYSFTVAGVGTDQARDMLVENSGRDIVGLEQPLGKVALLRSGIRRDRDKRVRHEDSPE